MEARHGRRRPATTSGIEKLRSSHARSIARPTPTRQSGVPAANYPAAPDREYRAAGLGDTAPEDLSTAFRSCGSPPDLGKVSGYGVYVIQLRTCPDKAALGALYVGSSWHTPADRMRQHNEGDKAGSSALRGQCRRLRPELYVDLPWHWERREAIAMENQRARRLAEAGFLVRCDGRVHLPASRSVPFTHAELERVVDQVERIIHALLISAYRELTSHEVVDALRWTPRDPALRELVATPNDQLGRFSHADRDAIGRLVERIMHRRRQQVVRLRAAT